MDTGFVTVPNEVIGAAGVKHVKWNGSLNENELSLCSGDAYRLEGASMMERPYAIGFGSRGN